MNMFSKWRDAGQISNQAYCFLTGAHDDSPADISVTKQDTLKISVAVSTYNRSRLLIRLIRSIVMQDYSNYEIVIVDDASTDDTNEVVNKYIQENPDVEIKYYKNSRNMNVDASKRTAYEACSGDVIIFSDDDDYYIDRLYFRSISNLYQKHNDCIMTIAPTISHHEQDNRFELNPLAIASPLSTKEYLNGFITKYPKPASMFTQSMRASSIASIGYGELLCFNDTPIYLFGLLAQGNVYVLDQATGIYSIRGNNMTGNTKADFIIKNLDAKYDIYQRAHSLGLLERPERWISDQLRITADHYLVGNAELRDTDRSVWAWMKGHQSAVQYYRYVAHVFFRRIRRRSPINFRSIA